MAHSLTSGFFWEVTSQDRTEGPSTQEELGMSMPVRQLPLLSVLPLYTPLSHPHNHPKCDDSNFCSQFFTKACSRADLWEKAWQSKVGAHSQGSLHIWPFPTTQGWYCLRARAIPSVPSSDTGLKKELRGFPGVQWMRILLPIQGTQLRSLVWEDSTRLRAARLVHQNYWARLLQLLKPESLEPALCSWRSHCNEKSLHCNQEYPPLPRTRKSPNAAMKSAPSTAKNK